MFAWARSHQNSLFKRHDYSKDVVCKALQVAAYVTIWKQHVALQGAGTKADDVQSSA